MLEIVVEIVISLSKWLLGVNNNLIACNQLKKLSVPYPGSIYAVKTDRLSLPLENQPNLIYQKCKKTCRDPVGKAMDRGDPVGRGKDLWGHKGW